MVLGADLVSGQDYPNRPIRIITGAPGGGGDLATRLIAQGLTQSMGQPVVVDNRGNLAGEIASKAPPDGYSVLVEGASFWLASLLQKTPYDALRDFSPLTLAASTPNVLVVHPSVMANSVKELIELAKARPKALNYASSGTGGSAHLSAELFKSMAGVDIVHVPYKGTGAALNSLIGGEVQLMFSNAASVTPHVRSGRLRALAVTSAERSPLFPDLPTVAASGLPRYEALQILAAFAPAKTPTAIINRLNREIVRVLKKDDIKERFFSAALETVGSLPEELAATIKSEIAKWGKVIKDAGIREE